ncbi:MAG: hypothetical protein ACRDTJ_00860, partial [Pseudonocardiaceae bacterium]
MAARAGAGAGSAFGPAGRRPVMLSVEPPVDPGRCPEAFLPRVLEAITPPLTPAATPAAAPGTPPRIAPPAALPAVLLAVPLAILLPVAGVIPVPIRDSPPCLVTLAASSLSECDRRAEVAPPGRARSSGTSPCAVPLLRGSGAPGRPGGSPA